MNNLMEGVEVLNVIEYEQTQASAGIVTFLGVLAIICIVIGIFLFATEHILGGGILEIIAVVTIIGMGVYLSKAPITTIYHYQATINDSVKMEEFLEKYEIIEVQGKIFTIKEKE